MAKPLTTPTLHAFVVESICCSGPTEHRAFVIIFQKAESRYRQLPCHVVHSLIVASKRETRLAGNCDVAFGFK